MAPDLCAYQYGAFFAWLAWRYSPLNSTLTYALPHDKLRHAYWSFLLSPWSWGRDPIYLEFDECVKHMEPNTALYCVYQPVLPNRVYVFSSSSLLMINATVLQDKILLALVATRPSTADPSVTVSYCPACEPATTTTVTVTETVTKTETYTVTHTTTYTTTYTVTVPITYTTTTTVSVTHTTTVTVPTTSTVTETVTVPVIYTTTVTVPTTYTDTVTKTETVVVTVPVTYTATETVTYTVTVADIGQESDRCMRRLYIAIALVTFIILCLILRKDMTMNKEKRFNNYGSAIYT
jgi:hypothetical protein